MIKITMHYMRYALVALASVAFIGRDN